MAHLGDPAGPGGACRRPSLDVAAAAGASLGVGAVGLRGQGLVEGVEAGVGGQGVPPRRHPLVDAIQTLGLLEAGDLMLGREAFDGCREGRRAQIKGGGRRRDFKKTNTPTSPDWTLSSMKTGLRTRQLCLQSWSEVKKCFSTHVSFLK